ncbi:hypothetical protein MAIT1_00911 [Magnetofaba australis IT-1]|uniref:Uncharacterized protein n=1 Tax=Magnetofaba australis IT-1 TaxID=1434232 RepID=A0A1Y2JZP7_9PROT|nr:hypothetical protein MAIT1_00911 [Magnetofaba australis IT-1]
MPPAAFKHLPVLGEMRAAWKIKRAEGVRGVLRFLGGDSLVAGYDAARTKQANSARRMGKQGKAELLNRLLDELAARCPEFDRSRTPGPRLEFARFIKTHAAALGASNQEVQALGQSLETLADTLRKDCGCAFGRGGRPPAKKDGYPPKIEALRRCLID